MNGEVRHAPPPECRGPRDEKRPSSSSQVIIFREYTVPKKNVERERGEYDWEKEYADKATTMHDCWERPEKMRSW